MVLVVKNLPANVGHKIAGLILGQEDLLEDGVATHSSIVWRIPWTEESGSYSPWSCKREGQT